MTRAEERNLTPEELLELGLEYIKIGCSNIFIKDKYFSLKNDYTLDDLVNYVFVCYYKKDANGKNMFEKWNPEITSFKYHIIRSIETKFIDLLRKQTSGNKSQNISLEEEIGEGITVADTLGVCDTEEIVESREARNSIIKALPNEANHMEGESPLTGKGYLTLRVLALHLEYGYTKEEIGKFFFYKGRTISASTVDKYTRELRTYMVENRLV